MSHRSFQFLPMCLHRIVHLCVASYFRLLRSRVDSYHQFCHHHLVHARLFHLLNQLCHCHFPFVPLPVLVHYPKNLHQHFHQLCLPRHPILVLCPHCLHLQIRSGPHSHCHLEPEDSHLRRCQPQTHLLPYVALVPQVDHLSHHFEAEASQQTQRCLQIQRLWLRLHHRHRHLIHIHLELGHRLLSLALHLGLCHQNIGNPG
eukprot:01637.XXX_1565_2170_1 [CDS] Oithona nana genome sequencing.